ncbi:MAG: hypothetical protein IKD61_05960 [Oscillospiraceae bacterium]|nr:hypothetical protein [Oscillospiraceae bacterium]MBR6352688.1 hypothetical protein [Oscillospiraceae bacterium]
MFALNLSADKRILSATYEQYAGPGQPLVEELPEGDISDYRYVDGEYVYDPITAPAVRVCADRNCSVGDVVSVDGVMYEAISAIPKGGAVIVGQNAIVTSLEEQLAKLKGEST